MRYIFFLHQLMRYTFILISTKFYQDLTIHNNVEHVYLCDKMCTFEKNGIRVGYEDA